MLVEAFSTGTPALVSNLGSMAEIIKVNKTGLHFESGNKDDLIEKVEYLLNNPTATRSMGYNARQEYLAKYTSEINVLKLLDIYSKAISMGCYSKQ